ncbi:isocitrate dehydrogenase [NAD] subunit alpha, mitochondrial [Drosophila kikkawai]|uniref:isocitrate dehydrogenase (NAD(+)) n=1 Tax=Drosophila kikkawai TaxID=30033 RepID=A0A6P4HMP2_DROKI|nr:isocitrate dehydrogenase [NAD] subunit alpha, mitochondrial [Drosophila kikkawai]
MNLVRRLRVGQLGSWAASFRPYSGKDKDKGKSKPDPKTPPKTPPKAEPKKDLTKAKDKSQEKDKGKGSNKGADKGKSDSIEANGFPKDTTKITLIKGEGAGPELMSAVQEVFKAAKAPVEWDVHDEYQVSPDNEDVAPAILESLRKNRVGLKGPVDSRHWQRHIRNQFKQYAYVSACKNIQGLETPYGEFDVMIIRDQSEGDYSGVEHSVVPGVWQTIKVGTTDGARRLANFVFLYATMNNRKKITVAHKANIMKMTDGNFLEAMQRLADTYKKKIKFEDRYLDTVCLNMLMKPDQTDVLTSSSMYGDVMRVIAGSMMGAPGICPGFSVSALGTVFDCRMKSDLANPTGPLLAAVLMLRHIKQEKHADRIECAIRGVYRDTDIRTEDLGGTATCSEFAEAVCERLEGN